MKSYNSFNEFYPYYLSEHQNPVCRLLHVIGSTLVLGLIAYAIVYQEYKKLYYLPLIGYGFAWLGHFFFEKNRPATFTYPLYSFMGDWVMFKDVITRKISIQNHKS